MGTFDQKNIISIRTLCGTRRPTSKMSEYIRPGKRSFSLLCTNILAVMTFFFHDRKKINLTNRRIIYVALNENEVKLLGCLENLHACLVRHSINL